MNKIHPIPSGTIEGFFGRSWSWENRRIHLEFLKAHNFSFYIYAPKSDPQLRRNWQQDWTPEQKRELQKLRDHSRSLKLKFGIGLSPLELYLSPSGEQVKRLEQRVIQLNEMQPDILCILFDDMRGDLPDLAQRQIDLCHAAAQASSAKQIIFCPSYYSFDPILEKVFGKMPEAYWQTLGRDLDSNIEIFWTGEKVCSPSYSRDHLLNVGDLLQRKPFLWDNYPVNDGAVKSKLLHLRAVPQSHNQIGDLISGHALNPMNQALLSQPAIASLDLAYQLGNQYHPEQVQLELLVNLFGQNLGQYLADDIAIFQDQGLAVLDADNKACLLQKYQRFANFPAALELIEWLEGGYTFDPSCLTD